MIYKTKARYMADRDVLRGRKSWSINVPVSTLQQHPSWDKTLSDARKLFRDNRSYLPLFYDAKGKTKDEQLFEYTSMKVICDELRAVVERGWMVYIEDGLNVAVAKRHNKFTGTVKDAHKLIDSYVTDPHTADVLHQVLKAYTPHWYTRHKQLRVYFTIRDDVITIHFDVFRPHKMSFTEIYTKYT